jgi:hypothetical protein
VARSRFLDPAWWPAFYNGVSFVIWLAVLARLFSSRLDLPGKPWLALAIIAVPHTGEVFFNITNLQWLTAFRADSAGAHPARRKPRLSVSPISESSRL